MSVRVAEDHPQEKFRRGVERRQDQAAVEGTAQVKMTQMAATLDA